MRNYLYVLWLAIWGRAQPKPDDGGGPPTPPDVAPPPKQ